MVPSFVPIKSLFSDNLCAFVQGFSCFCTWFTSPGAWPRHDLAAARDFKMSCKHLAHPSVHAAVLKSISDSTASLHGGGAERCTNLHGPCVLHPVTDESTWRA